MNRAMINASVTMGQIQRQIDTIANNIANVNTIGYKRREVTFSDLLFQQVNNQLVPSQEVGRLTPNGIRVGSGAKVAQTAVRMNQGNLQKTDRELDVAITQKDQFFQVQVYDNGEMQVRYTKDGSFYFSPNPNNPNELYLVTGQGHFVLGQNGPIVIPANHQGITISENGLISITDENGNIQDVAQLELVRVHRPQMLEQIGENLFVLPDNLVELGYVPADILNVIPPAEVSVRQGYIEMSNVDLSKELTDLINAQRSYQFNARSVTMADQMLGLINSIRS